MLIDRCCVKGGWNYGNSNVFGHALKAFVPTTAIALLAMQDQATEPAVARSRDYLEREATSERSGLALSLALMCLAAYGRPTTSIRAALAEQVPMTLTFGNHVSMALTLCALQPGVGMRPFFSTPPEPVGPETRSVGRPSLGLGISRREFLRAIPVSLLAVGMFAPTLQSQPIPRCRSLDRRAVRGAFLRRGFQRRDRAGASELGVDVRGKRVFPEAEHGGVRTGHGDQHRSARHHRRGCRLQVLPGRRRSSSGRAPDTGATRSISSPGPAFTITFASIASASST